MCLLDIVVVWLQTVPCWIFAILLPLHSNFLNGCFHHNISFFSPSLSFFHPPLSLYISIFHALSSISLPVHISHLSFGLSTSSTFTQTRKQQKSISFSINSGWFSDVVILFTFSVSKTGPQRTHAVYKICIFKLQQIKSLYSCHLGINV